MKTNKKIIIIGSGLSGHFTAMTLQYFNPLAKYIIINDESTPTIGVGESGILDLPVFIFEQAKIDINEFYHEVHPIHKMGINFRDWVKKDFNYNYTFDSGSIREYLGINEYLVGHEETTFGCYLIKNNLTPLSFNNFCYRHFSYQIDNLKFVSFLKKTAMRRGIEYISKKVIDVEFEKSNKIKNLVLEDNEKIEADFYIDCSGFNGVIAKSNKTPFVSFKKYLPCDYAVVGQHEISIDEIKSYTVSTRKPFGWQWEIDTSERAGKGYVFCSDFTTKDEATQKFISDNPKIKTPRIIPFPTGKYENICGENYLLNGNAQGFAEPLESTGFSITFLTISNFIRIIQNDTFLNETKQKLLNNFVKSIWSFIVDFLVLHYKYNEPIDNNGFWEYCQNELMLSENMNFIIDFIKENEINSEIKKELEPYWVFDPIFSLDGIFVHANARNLLKVKENMYYKDDVLQRYKKISNSFLSEKNMILNCYNNINFENYINNKRYLNEFF